MKIPNTYRLCFVGVLIVAMMVAWSTAMPSHMSHGRPAIIGGCPPPCTASDYDYEDTPCSEYGDCTGWHRFAWPTSFEGEYDVRFRNAGNCPGDPECNWIVSSTWDFDCYLN
jgi:hypothetical protein